MKKVANLTISIAVVINGLFVQILNAGTDITIVQILSDVIFQDRII